VPTGSRESEVSGFRYGTSALRGGLIAFALAQRGVSAALALIAGCMAVVALAIGVLGPKTRGRSLEDLND